LRVAFVKKNVDETAICPYLDALKKFI